MLVQMLVIRILRQGLHAMALAIAEHASSGPQLLPAWNPNAGGIAAFYFRDPDGNHLEVLHFPDGKGDPKWHRKSERLFLGIDHTAIVVADTDESLGFYRDALGLRVAGASENYGPEQERLNNVFGARLRITALRAARGPGVELLDVVAYDARLVLAGGIVDDDIGAGLGERERDPATDTRARARDECLLTLQHSLRRAARHDWGGQMRSGGAHGDVPSIGVVDARGFRSFATRPVHPV